MQHVAAFRWNRTSEHVLDHFDFVNAPLSLHLRPRAVHCAGRSDNRQNDIMPRFLPFILAALLAVAASPAEATPRPVQDAAHSQRVPETDSLAPDASVLDDPFVRENGRLGLNLLYDLKSDSARAVFDRINERYPEHPIGPFLQGLNLWWTILVDLTDTSHDEAFYAQMNEVIARCDEILEDDPDHFDAKFFKGAALGFRGRLRSNRDQWMKAAYDGKRAIGYVRDVAEKAPDNDDYVFGKGMYDYYAAIIPEQYPVSKMVMWLMPDGDKTRGLSLIERTAEDGWYVQTEAVYFLTQIYYLYEESFNKSRQYVMWLRKEHPNNSYFHLMEGRVYAKWGRWGTARDVFTKIVDRHEAGKDGYNAHVAEVAHYYLARDLIYRDEYEAALRHLADLEGLASRESAADQRYRAYGYLYQGMVYDALGRRDLAESRYREVLRMDDGEAVHDRAEEYLAEPYGG